jgi:hypothetical protein
MPRVTHDITHGNPNPWLTIGPHFHLAPGGPLVGTSCIMTHYTHHSTPPSQTTACCRLKDELGMCNVGRKALVSTVAPHFAEEAPLKGWRGSGTVFFSMCNLRCVFCQNWDISQQRAGEGTASPLRDCGRSSTGCPSAFSQLADSLYCSTYFDSWLAVPHT